MNSHEVNQKLTQMYIEFLNQSSLEIEKINQSVFRPEEKLSNPLLLTVNEQYTDADIKVMFFGQETNGWCEEVNEGAFSGELSALLSLYDRFYWGEQCNDYGGPFWKGLKEIKQAITDTFSSCSKIGFIWNNVIKLGKCSVGFPVSLNETITLQLLHQLLYDEVALLKPDILIFLSGYRYDSYIDRTFGKFTQMPVEGYEPHQLCQLDLGIPALVIRTYHPNFLSRKKIKNEIFSVVNRLIRDKIGNVNYD